MRVLADVPHVQQIPVHLPDIDIPTPEEVAIIIRALPAHLQPLVRLLAETGCRKGEALNLRWADVNEVTGEVSFRYREDWSPKNKESERKICIGENLLGIIRSLPKKGKYVFPGRDDPNKPMNNFRKALLTAIKSAKVTRNDKPMHITPHVLRKSYITWQIRKGVPEATIQKQVGHAKGSRITTRHYNQTSNDDLRGAVFELPKVQCAKHKKYSSNS